VRLPRAAAPELIIAAVAVAVTAAAGYAMAGAAGVAVVALAAAVTALIVLRTLVPDEAAPDDRADPRPARRPARDAAPTMTGYWGQRHRIAAGIAGQNSYDTGLRRALEHLLAARLAERHGINLYEDPAAARRAFCAHPRDAALWPWIDPEREADTVAGGSGAGGPGAGGPGIPRRTLGRLLDRLEQL